MALILSRREGEKLVIGTDVVLEVVEVVGNRVRLAVTAPRHVPVVRAELIPVARRADPAPPGGEAT